jgi:hypothetical protein
MAGAPPPEDETTDLVADFSHVSLDQFSPYNDDPGASYLSHQAAGASDADTYFPEPSDYNGSSTNDPPPPFDPENPFVCYFQYQNGKMCYAKRPRQCDLT